MEERSILETILYIIFAIVTCGIGPLIVRYYNMTPEEREADARKLREIQDAESAKQRGVTGVTAWPTQDIGQYVQFGQYPAIPKYDGFFGNKKYLEQFNYLPDIVPFKSEWQSPRANLRIIINANDNVSRFRNDTDIHAVFVVLGGIDRVVDDVVALSKSKPVLPIRSSSDSALTYGVLPIGFSIIRNGHVYVGLGVEIPENSEMYTVQKQFYGRDNIRGIAMSGWKKKFEGYWESSMPGYVFHFMYASSFGDYSIVDIAI